MQRSLSLTWKPIVFSSYIVCVLHYDLKPCLFLNSIQHRWLLSGYDRLHRFHVYFDHSFPHQTYDYACSFHEEVIRKTPWSTLFLISLYFKWTFLRRSCWTRIKVLYIVTRYAPFLLLVVHLYCTSSEHLYSITDNLLFSEFYSKWKSQLCTRNSQVSNYQHHLLWYSFIYRTWNCALTFLLLSQCSVLYPSSAQNVTTISWSLCGWFLFLQVSSSSGRMRYGITTKSFWQSCYRLLLWTIHNMLALSAVLT